MTTAREYLHLAREYLRVSMDRSGRERSIHEQHDENERAAAEHRFTLGDPYSDNGSASRYAQKVRGDFGTLLADLAADRFGAEILLLWESSRGSRKVGEWVELIELCERRQVRIHVTTHGRTYDPGNARDRRSLLEDAVDSEYESAKISTRARRAAAANGADGRPHGRVPFGYQRSYDPRTGKLAGQEPHPAEAPLIRELFDRIVKGHALRAIARDWEARDIRRRHNPKRPDGPFSAAHLRTLAVNVAYDGKRLHDPGRQSGNRQRLSGRATVVDATWPPLVDHRAFLAAQRILSDPARRKVIPGRGKHLLSMIARCDACGAPLAATRRGSGEQYQCHVKGCVRVNKAAVDAIAEAAMLGWLSRPDNVERLTADDGDDEQLEAVRAEIGDIRAELDDLADQVGRGELSAALAARAEPAILARLRDAEDREDELSTPSALRGLMAPGEDVAQRWKAAPMSARRDVARLLLTPAVLGELRVRRNPPGRRVPAADRLVWKT